MQPLQIKPDLTAQTHEAIRTAIMSGDLAPGAPLAQEELAERLGVSRQPISHALVLLKREGLVVDRGRKGQMVAPIEAGRLLDLYQVRGSLDRLAARLAAEKSVTPGNRTMAFGELMRKGTAAVAAGDISRLVEADVAFHKSLHLFSGNAEIARTADGMWPHMVRSMRVVLEDEASWGNIWAEHAAITEAVVAGDVDRAGELASQHAEAAGETTFRRLKNDVA